MSSIITATGNLAATPVLREGKTGPYTFARVLVSDSVRDDEGNYTDGPTMAYNVAVSGQQATALVATAEACGNIRVTFTGRYRVATSTDDKGTVYTNHEVRAEEIGASFRGQTITVERSAKTEDPAEGDKPF